MNKEETEALKSKRLKLQEEIRLKDLRKRVATQLSQIEALGESFVVYYKFEHLNWIQSNVQVRSRDGYAGVLGDFQIDVHDADAISSLTLKEEEINSDKFKEQFSLHISSESRLVVCYQGGDPEIECSANAFLNHPTEFFSRPETWVVTTDKKWIIEYIWEQGVMRFIQLQDSIPTLIHLMRIETKKHDMKNINL